MNIKKNDCQFSVIHIIKPIIGHLNQCRDSWVERAKTRLQFRENRIDFQIVIKLLKNFFLENFNYYWQDWNGSIISHVTTVIAFIDQARTWIFPVINKNSGGKWQIKYKSQRWSNYTRCDLTSINFDSNISVMKSNITILNVKNLNSEKTANAKRKIETFLTLSKLSKLETSTNFWIISGIIGSFLLIKQVPISLLAAGLLTSLITGLSIGEGIPAKL